MVRLFVILMFVAGISCTKKDKEVVVKNSPTPTSEQTSVQTEPSQATPAEATPAQSKPIQTKSSSGAKVESNPVSAEDSEKTVIAPKSLKPFETSEKEAVAKTQTQPEPAKSAVKEEVKPAAKKVNQPPVTLAAGQSKSMDFAGNTKPLVNGGSKLTYTLSDINRLKILGVKFELNLNKVPLDHIISFSYAGRFDIYVTTDIGLRKICGEGFAETPIQVKGRKPGRPFEFTLPRVVLSSFIGEDDCVNSVSKSNLPLPANYSIAPVNGKSQLEIFIHEPIQVTITNHLNEVVPPGTFPVGFNVIVQTEISN